MGSRGGGDNENYQGNRVFVGGISWKADEQSLANFFSSYGKVIECKIIMDKVTGKSKGYGFVTFQDVETAEQVKQATNLYFLGKMMNVGDAVRKNESKPQNQPSPQQQQQPQQSQSGYSQQGFQQQQGYFNPYYNQGYQQSFNPNYVQQGQQQFYNPSPYYAQQNYYQPQFQQTDYQQASWQPMPNYAQPQQGFRQAPSSPTPTTGGNPGAGGLGMQSSTGNATATQGLPVAQQQLLQTQQLQQQVGAQLQQQLQQLQQQMAVQSPAFVPQQVSHQQPAPYQPPNLQSSYHLQHNQQ